MDTNNNEMLALSIPLGEAQQLYTYLTKPNSPLPARARNSITARLHQALHDRTTRNHL